MTDQPLPTLDAERILATLIELGVDFVVIGGVAAQTHGCRRMTADIGLIPAPDPANLRNLASALTKLGARILNHGHEDEEITAALLPRATIWQFSTSAGGIDVMHEVPGGRPYSDLRESALQIHLDGNTIAIAGLDDLIAMKLARGRQVDLEDVAALTRPAGDLDGDMLSL